MNLPATAQNIIDTLHKAGFEAYAIGGSVRDLIMGKETKGWDFTTNATPAEIQKLFPESFYDNQFGTVGIKIYKNNSQIPNPKSQTQIYSNEITNEKSDDIYEITTYRSEKGYGDLRHPETVTWGTSLMEDLARRDFTVNAIAYDGKKIIDPYDGQKDIKIKLIRAVGNPNDRFSEDALRMMRAVRIGAQLGFLIEEQTRLAIEKNAQLLTKISIERIHDELLKLFASDFPADGVLLLKNSGILAILLPELDEAFVIGQKSPNRHHIFDVGTHSVMALKYCPSKDPIVRLATLLHDVGKPKTVKVDEKGTITFYNHEIVGSRIVKNITSRLRFSKKDADRIYTLVRWHQFSVDERQTDSAIRRIIRRVGVENLEDILALRIGDRLGGGAQETSWRLELFKKRLVEVQKQPFSVTDLKVNGYDVMDIFKIKPGKIIGETLDAIFKEVESGTLPNDREIQLSKLHELKPK